MALSAIETAEAIQDLRLKGVKYDSETSVLTMPETVYNTRYDDGGIFRQLTLLRMSVLYNGIKYSEGVVTGHFVLSQD